MQMTIHIGTSNMHSMCDLPALVGVTGITFCPRDIHIFCLEAYCTVCFNHRSVLYNMLILNAKRPNDDIKKFRLSTVGECL